MKVILLFLFIGAAQGLLGGFWRRWTEPKVGPKMTPELGQDDEPEPEPVMSKGVVIPLTLRNNILLGRVTVGTARRTEWTQELSLNIDLTSAVVVLNSGEICRKKDCSKLSYKTFFGERSRSYGKTTRKPWGVEGGDFDGKGFYARDHFKFEMAYKTIIIKNQEFLEANVIKKPFSGYDGKFGLALKTGNSLLESSPVHTMEKQFMDVDPVFGIYMNTRPGRGEIGSLILGGGDEQFYKNGDVRSHDVLQTYGEYIGWYIDIQSLVVIPKEGDRFEIDLHLGPAIPAPELHYITFRQTHLDTIIEKLFSASSVVHTHSLINCDSDWKSLPDLAFVIGDHEYILTPEDYVIKNPATPEQCAVAFRQTSTINIQLGRPFLVKFYTRFDVKNKQVQFAESSREF